MPSLSTYCSIAIACLCSAAPSPAAAEPLQLAQIAAGIYVHQGRHLLPNIENRGEIANTHMHPDHVYGNAAFKHPGTHFVGHYKLGPALATRAPFYREKASRDLGFSLTTDDFVFPDREVRDTIDLDLGNRTLTLTAHKTAHTDNDLTVFDHQTATLWAGDLLFVDHTPVIDGSLNGWIEVLDQLKRVPAKRVVAGHGPISGDWPAAAQPEERYLRLLRNEIRDALRARRTMEQAMETVGRSERDAWVLFDEFHKRNVATAFAELEWEDD